MFATTGKIYTIEEYFELEKSSAIRHEYVRGTLIPMTGESKRANKIATNCLRFLAGPLEEKGFEVYVHDVRLMVEDGTLYRYPDLVIAPEADTSDTHAVIEPVLIIEVLSQTTAEKDRGIKLKEYTKLPSLQYYLLISQEEILVEMYSKRGNNWVLSFFEEKTASIPLSFFDLSLKIAAIYKRINFGPET